MDGPRRSSLRMLAPVALAAFAIVFLIVVFASFSGGDGRDGGGQVEAGQKEEPAAGTEAGDTVKPTKSTYTVKPGDTLDSIAESTGVSVDELQKLNPTLDPQALIAGTRLKLRE